MPFVVLRPTRPISPVAEHSPMETVFCPDDTEDLRGRNDTEELVVISLLNALQLQFHLIALLNQLLAGIFIGRLDHTLRTHLTIQATLLVLHLTEEREESCCLLGSQTCFLGDELLQVCLIFLRRELLLGTGRKQRAIKGYNHEECLYLSHTQTNLSIHLSHLLLIVHYSLIRQA